MGQVQKLFTTQPTTTEQEQLISQSNSKLIHIQRKFLFNANDISKLHEIFRKMDGNGTGYISQSNFFDFLEEELTSVVVPYVEYLFQLIEKEVEQRVSFSEWLPAISLYCLYSKDSIVSFVFKLLDNDHDTFISKKDLMTFLVQEREGLKIFYYNYIKAVELLDIERPDKISLDQFRKIQIQIPFICYPAFRLQKQLKSKIFGNQYWEQLYDRILHKENEENKLKQMYKIQEEMKKKQQIKIDKKIEKFVQNQQNIKSKSIPRIKNNKFSRQPQRNHSEPILPYNIDTPDELIQSVFAQLSKQLKGSVHQRKYKDLRVLRCLSKSLPYIKLPIKLLEDAEANNIRSSQFIRSQALITMKPNNNRKSIFQTKLESQQSLSKHTFLSSVSDDEQQ